MKLFQNIRFFIWLSFFFSTAGFVMSNSDTTNFNYSEGFMITPISSEAIGEISKYFKENKVFYVHNAGTGYNIIAIEPKIYPADDPHLEWYDTVRAILTRYQSVKIEKNGICFRKYQTPDTDPLQPSMFQLIPMTLEVFNRSVRPYVYNAESEELDFKSDQELRDFYLK